MMPLAAADPNDSLKQSKQIIKQYLQAAKLCIDTKPLCSDEAHILGYPAAVLLLCATDAIGHSLKERLKGGGTYCDDGNPHSRLDVLLQPWPFDLKPKLNCTQINQLRAGLAMTMNIGPLVLTNIGPPPGV
jgi:hypothetical protein